MKIREIEYQDYRDIVLMHRLIDRTSDWLQGGPWVNYSFCREHIENAKKYGWIILVAEVDERVVGEIEIVPGREPEPYGYNFHISLLYVHPKYSRKGIGRRLLETCISMAREAEVDTVTVVPSSSSREFYLKHGFRPLENWSRHRLSLNTEFDIASAERINIEELSEDFISRLPMHIGRYQSSKEAFDFAVRRTFSAMPEPIVFKFNNSVITLTGYKHNVAFCWGYSRRECIKNLLTALASKKIKETKILVRADSGEINIFRYANNVNSH